MENNTLLGHPSDSFLITAVNYHKITIVNNVIVDVVNNGNHPLIRLVWPSMTNCDTP